MQSHLNPIPSTIKSVIAKLSSPGTIPNKISQRKILAPKNKLRKYAVSDSLAVIEVFQNKLTKFNELPDDESFSRVLVAFRKLKMFAEAKEIFGLIQKNASPPVKEGVIGSYSCSAMLEIIRAECKQKFIKEEMKAALLQQAEKIWDQCERRGLVDNYIITNMMDVYRLCEKNEVGVKIFDRYSGKLRYDVPLYSKYAALVFATKGIEGIKRVLIKVEDMYRLPLSAKDLEAMKSIYYLLIDYYYQNKQLDQCLDLFKKGVKIGLYSNNCMEVKEGEKVLSLNFHTSKQYWKKEGGLPLLIAKIAFLYFIEQIKDEHRHWPVKLITGGSHEGQTKLKDAIPEYLKGTYQAEGEWNSNPRVLELIIPPDEIEKIIFLEKVFEHFQKNQPVDQIDDAYLNVVIGDYRANLRRINEDSPNKYFSDCPAIPNEFDEANKKLASDAMQYYQDKNYAKAKSNYDQLIKNLPSHPWPHIQLAWIYYRAHQNHDTAIATYNAAITLINDKDSENSKALLSDCYRKLGLAYNKKHSGSLSKKRFREISQCYKKAIEICQNNFEAYHNLGILLERKGSYEAAIQQLLVAYEHNLLNDEVCVHLGNCYKGLGKYLEASIYYQQAIERAQKAGKERSAAWAYCELGNLYLLLYEKLDKNDEPGQNYLDLAESNFLSCLKCQPNRDQAQSALAKIYALQGKEKETNEYRQRTEKTLPPKDALRTSYRENRLPPNAQFNPTGDCLSSAGFFHHANTPHVEEVGKKELSSQSNKKGK